MSSNATAATARLLTATAKAAAPGVRFVTTSQGPYSYRVVLHDTLLSGLADSVAGRQAADAIRALSRPMTTTWGRGRNGKIVINVTDEDVREDLAAEQAARRAAALDAARQEVAATRDDLAARADERSDAGQATPLVHLMGEDLLDACATVHTGPVNVAPATTPEAITCPPCRDLADQQIGQAGGIDTMRMLAHLDLEARQLERQATEAAVLADRHHLERQALVARQEGERAATGGPERALIQSRAHDPQELAALTTLEVVERLALAAHEAINRGDLGEARRLLVAVSDEATTRTATAVKSLGVSDVIARTAVPRVREIRTAGVPAPTTPAQAARVERHAQETALLAERHRLERAQFDADPT